MKNTLFPSPRTLFKFMLFQRWTETISWAFVTDLLCLSPKRAFSLFYVLLIQRKAHISFRKGEYDVAYRYGELALKRIPYVGEYPAKYLTLFFCHQIMGLICCDRGEWDEASRHLVACVNIKGSSTLRILVPWLNLPKQLIERGYTQSVMLYLDYLSDWWCCGFPLSEELCDQRTQAVNKWKRKVRHGRVPKEYPWPQK